MRPIFTGTLSFGLVNIPVKLYSATEHKATKFRLVHNKDKSPIKYKKFCEKENKEVEWKDIAKALEISKKNYVIFTKEELAKLKPAKSDIIEIVEFINEGQIDKIYFDTSYFLAPEKSKEKSFFLFKNVLQSTGKLAIARIIMREKEYTCSIGSYKSGLLLTTLNYDYEIRDINEIEELREAPKLKDEELNLAKTLINHLFKESFNISEFKDTFEDQLKDLVKKKGKGEMIETKTKVLKETDLIKALRASLK